MLPQPCHCPRLPFSSREQRSSTHSFMNCILISLFKPGCTDYNEEGQSDFGWNTRKHISCWMNLWQFFSKLVYFIFKTYNLLFSICFFTQIHLFFFSCFFAVDMKREYEYVCWRSKDIAYGEPQCIMQLFLSHLDSFRHTHTHTEIHTITCIEKQGYKSFLRPPFPTLLLQTVTHKVTSMDFTSLIHFLQQIDFLCGKPCSSTDNSRQNSFRPNNSWRGNTAFAVMLHKNDMT